MEKTIDIRDKISSKGLKVTPQRMRVLEAILKLDNHPTAEQNLSQWFVDTRFPEFAKTGGGFGFSMIAEAYLNFGWIGTPIVLATLGFLYTKFIRWASRTDSPLKIATVASFMSFFLLFTRGESYLLPRYIVWYSFLPYLLVQYIPVIKMNLKEEA